MLLAISANSAHLGLAKPVEAPYGSWQSPVSAEMLVQGAIRFGDVAIDGDTVYWVEGRPQEGGRYVIVRRRPDGTVDDILPPPYSARTTLHEYGGGALLAVDGRVFFTNYADQGVWSLTPGDPPTRLTPEGKLRFADYVMDARHNRLLAICEDHSLSDDEPANRIVAVDATSGDVTTLVEGADFYSNPRISPDGRQLCWLSWNHPNMPWDGTVLYVAPIEQDGAIGKPRKVAGGDQESIFQPSWSPTGTLFFVSDRSNWWNLYAERGEEVSPVLAMDAEFGVPQWVFGMATYGFDPDGNILARCTRNGAWRVLHINPDSGQHSEIALPYSAISSMHLASDAAYVIAGAPTEVESFVRIALPGGELQVIRRGAAVEITSASTSVPEAIEFPTEGGKTAHAFYYPPMNAEFRGPKNEAPPLLILVHGGPTSATSAQLRLGTQYWTSRGIAVCDVNYGGSTGYGREYRNRLQGAWGIVDVKDAENAARYLAAKGKVDPAKLLIRGGSAGGYTTLACLAFSDVFRCGASYYGVSDLALLVRDTHKFESRYQDGLVGRLPEDEELYRERSPLFHLDGFDRPVILLQGLEDKVVPPNQAEVILAALKKKGVPVAYVPFAGEQHGFRRAETIIRAHQAELYFYSRILGFEPAETIQPVEIFNLPQERDAQR